MKHSNTSWIAGLLALALFVSAVGMYSMVSKLSATGLATGTTNATISATTDISLSTNTVAFGNIAIQGTNDTADNSPPPFRVKNDGSVNVNVTVNSTALWATQTSSSSYYQTKCRANTSACPTGSVTSWTNMPVNTAASTLIANLSFNDSADTVYVDIGITVPLKESAAAKSATVTFKASQA